jgi:hypothetical protein
MLGLFTYSDKKIMSNFLFAYRKAALKHAQHNQLLLHTILRTLSGFSQFYVFAFL